MDIYEAVWKTLFVIKAVERTGNENILQLVSAANDAYATRESGLTQRAPDVAYCTCKIYIPSSFVDPQVCRECGKPPRG